jgi:uncharacterized protein YdcH (DUF465 family)
VAHAGVCGVFCVLQRAFFAARRSQQACPFVKSGFCYYSLQGVPMFPEYRDLITKLKGNDAHFTRLFDKHNEMDQQIKNMEARIVQATAIEIENLKKEKLQLKDKIYTHLRNVESSQA